MWIASLDGVKPSGRQSHRVRQNWFARFGAPKSVTTDRGPQFESTRFAKLCESLGCEHIRTTAYHPAANGMVERLHRQVKAALMSHPDREHWVVNLPIVFLGIRSSFKPDAKACAAELVCGSTLRLFGQFLEQTTSPAPGDVNDLLHRLRQLVRSQQPQPPRVSNASSFLDPRLKTCSLPAM